MKNVSDEFRKKMKEGAQFYQTANVLFADGTNKELERKDFYISGNSYSDGPGTNSFPLGEAMAKNITMSLVNDDDRFSDYDFYMAQIAVWLKCDLSETTESILLGTYTVTTPESYGAQITLTALDDMYKGDADYTTKISYPATIGTILRDSCTTCGVNLLSSTFSNDSFMVKDKPENITHRQLWGMIAMIAGGNARMNENNYLEIVEYDFSYFEKAGLDGGSFDNNSPYISGDNADGGDFTDWKSGDSVDGGDFEELKNFHMFYKNKTPTIATDDVVITGVQTTVDDTEHLYGTEGYVLKLENQLFQVNTDEVLELIGVKVVGLRFRPFTIDHKAYPLAEFGDICYVADRKGNVYQSVVTDISFTFFGYTTISCVADDPLRNSSKYYSTNTEAIIKARKNTEKQLSAYDLAVQQLTNLITNAFGVFKTEELQEDGSIIYYLHNKPEMANSSNIWKMTADAFVVSSDGGETWNAGIDASGNAIVNVLSAIGINAEWLNAGEIVGIVIRSDSGNTDGSLEVSNGLLRLYDQYGKLWLQTTDNRLNFKKLDATPLKMGLGNANSATGLNASVNMILDGSTHFEIGAGASVVSDPYISINQAGQRDIILYGTLYALGINGSSLSITGTKSRLTDTENYGRRLLYCFETPSPMFGDIGEGIIDETGKCYIFLDDIFSETIDTDCMYQVFVQPYGKGECFVSERTSTYFVVEGTENLAFGWELKAIQKDYDTMRLEEYEESQISDVDSVLIETTDYLEKLLYDVTEVENE